MLEVLSAVTGKSIAVFADEEIADVSVKALKQHLARKIGLPRFRLRLLEENNSGPLDDNQTFAMQVVQLVILEFLPPDREQDQGIMVACEENDDKLLEQHLNKPRSPNFQDANQFTPLYAAASNGSLKCVLLLLEAGANKDQGWYWSNSSTCMEGHNDLWLSRVPTKTKAGQMMGQRSFCSSWEWTLKLSDFWLSRVPTKTKAGQMMEQRLFT